jgi:MoxR-like ATPase
MEEIFAPRTDLSKLSQAVTDIRASIGQVVIGQYQLVDLMIAGILCDGHILIEGVPGIAKTLSSKLLARSINVGFSRLQFTPDLMPSDVVGTSVFDPKEVNFRFKQGPIFSNIVLIDEINRAPAKTQAALFEVMEEKQVTVDGNTYKMQEPFLVLATQNPIEQEGTYRLPEAQLDRFLFKIDVQYPTLEEEIKILMLQQNETAAELLQKVQPVLNAQDIAIYRQLVKNIIIEQKLIDYIAKLVNETRNNANLYLGASPRASIAILKSSKAMAAIKGRDFVTPEDIIEVAPHVLRHRIILTPEKEMEGTTPDELIKKLIESLEVPR